jgi:hypothetical protein
MNEWRSTRGIAGRPLTLDEAAVAGTALWQAMR